MGRRKKNLLRDGWKYDNKNKQPRCKLCGKWIHVGGTRKVRIMGSCGLLICNKCREKKRKIIPLINKNFLDNKKI